MNERIKELMIQSGAYEHYEINEGVDGDELPMVKLAELIVKECAELNFRELGLSGSESFDVGEMIEQHFGVEG